MASKPEAEPSIVDFINVLRIPSSHYGIKKPFRNFLLGAVCCWFQCQNPVTMPGPDFTNGPSLKKCSRCRRARYCSTACQKADWKWDKIVCGKTELRVWRIWARSRGGCWRHAYPGRLTRTR
ncbi:hypothetical protein M427DRAFT_296275 [Gonapodya prolifera JEL478]|uniref:MYND-type domain-containing protein n=1 Tax=Gonapodya prolifera (strain JEL478) TaxID=1344416 RepID=A0A139AHN0_GONPJ|nr:hypothetical protein M427DRAFT_296275 [Gonapodya prolifera JEL478]|eukprot:KXS16331.1 hypothetical protein M427DRAFT_296275 [Gonapodya prolifera JEL478]